MDHSIGKLGVMRREAESKKPYYPPRAGDGTLHEVRPRPTANQFGLSLEPQEEFIDDGIASHVVETAASPSDKGSASPHLFLPPAPADVFPFGDPAMQVDG